VPLASGGTIVMVAMEDRKVAGDLVRRKSGISSQIAPRPPHSAATTPSEQSSRSVSLTILVPGADGQWQILRQMWGPPLR
jgi:hypothetical protein